MGLIHSRVLLGHLKKIPLLWMALMALLHVVYTQGRMKSISFFMKQRREAQESLRWVLGEQ